MDDDFDAYDAEALPDFRLRNGLDINSLRIGEGQEFEVDIEDTQNGKVDI